MQRQVIMMTFVMIIKNWNRDDDGEDADMYVMFYIHIISRITITTTNTWLTNIYFAGDN